MYCTHCGGVIDDNAMVCPHCGCATVNYLRRAPKKIPRRFNVPAVVGIFLSVASAFMLVLSLVNANFIFVGAAMAFAGLVISIVGCILTSRYNSGVTLSVCGIMVGCTAFALMFLISIFVALL